MPRSPLLAGLAAMPAALRRLLLTALVATVLVPLAITVTGQFQNDRVHQVAERFAAAWRDGTLDQLEYANAAGSTVATAVNAITAGLAGSGAGSSGTAGTEPGAPPRPVQVEVTATSRNGGRLATATLRVRWLLHAGLTWQYDSTLNLQRSEADWKPLWQPQVIHPRLDYGHVLSATALAARRGEIVGARGEALVGYQEVTHVGVVPARSEDLRATGHALADALGMSPEPLIHRIVYAPGEQVLELATVRRDRAPELARRLSGVPGVVLRTVQEPVPAVPHLAEALLGVVGPAGTSQVQAARGRLGPGQLAGLSGLAARYDDRLGGRDGVLVRALPPAGPDQARLLGRPAGPAVRQLLRIPARDGQAVRVSLDLNLQEAADAAVAGSRSPTSLVALQASTGEVLAVANGGPSQAAGTGGTGQASPSGPDRALLGQYHVADLLPGPVIADLAPGSTGTDRLRAAAGALGFGTTMALGTPAFTGRIDLPADTDPDPQVLARRDWLVASPLGLAGASAAVATGHRQPPRLVLDPGGGEAIGSGPGAGLPAAALTSLRALVGTGSPGQGGAALRAVPGAPVQALLGTGPAASGTALDAWVTGYRQDVAFAVVVEGGGNPAGAAAIAAAFLHRLA